MYLFCVTKAEIPEWDLGNLDSAAGLGWFHLLCDPEVTSLPCKPALLSLLSPWYKAFWIRVPAIMTSLTWNCYYNTKNNFRALFLCISQLCHPTADVHVGVCKHLLWKFWVVGCFASHPAGENILCDSLPVFLADERGMLLGWKETLMVCKRGGSFEVERYERD